MEKLFALAFLLIVVVMVLSFDYFKGRKGDFKGMLLKADRAFEKGKFDKAKKQYEKIIRGL